MSRLFWKLFFALWGSIMLFALVTSLVNLHLARQEIPDPPEVTFGRSIQKVELMLASQLRTQGPDAARRVLRQIPRHIRNHVFLFDEQGHEILGREEVRRHVKERGLHHARRELRDDQNKVYELLVLRRAPPMALFAPDLRGLLHRLLLAALVSAMVSYFLARYLARPLDHLTRATRKLSAGDLDARVGAPVVMRHDEFGTLAREFDEMAQHLQQMQEANRRLLRDVSHELRSPLARLDVALELARSRNPGDLGEEIERIGMESQRLQGLVDEVLGLLREASETHAAQPECFDLAELLDDLKSAIDYELPEDLPPLKLTVKRPLPIKADRELLWRAIENLLRNALQHGQGKAVELDARRHHDGAAEISVSDRGPGIPEPYMNDIFTPFFRVQESRDRQSGGHGLGLAIAAAAVRRHHGSITAENRPRGGLRVTIRIP